MYHWHRPEAMTLPGGVTREFEYDPLMRIKKITAKDPGANVLMAYDYTYDKADNITAKATEHGDYAYGYDDLYRLTSADNPVQPDEAFTYDGVGNRLTSGDTTGEWAYNQNNELGGYDDVAYTYDANGNMTQKIAGGVVTSYVYNVEDRLTEVWDGEAGTGTLVASYYYDPFGRRLWKEVAGTRTNFHYADEGLIGEYDDTGAEIKTYGYKPGSTWTTDPLFMKVGTDYYFYQNDHLGTPQKMTAVNGAVVWSAKYSSFGKAEVDVASTVVNNLRFPGQYEDSETGLHYNYHRYYEPNIGRYLCIDPLNFASILNNGVAIKELFESYIDSKYKLIAGLRSKLYSKGDKYTIDKLLFENYQKQKYNNHLSDPTSQYLYNYALINPNTNIDPIAFESQESLKCEVICGVAGMVMCIALIEPFTWPLYFACEMGMHLYCGAMCHCMVH